MHNGRVVRSVVAIAAICVMVLGISRKLDRKPNVSGSLPVANAVRERQILAGYRLGKSYPELTFQYPNDGSVFPPESIAPSFAWSATATAKAQATNSAPKANTWLVHVTFDAGNPIDSIVASTEWTPDQPTWAAIKSRSVNHPARVTVLGVTARAPGTILAEKTITLTTSSDPVAAPLFYREVPLPFIDAVKDPSKIRWRFGAIDSYAMPPVVLENLPVCGNCHSFSSNGGVLGMDVDYANDKGSYAIMDTAPTMTMTKDKVITWSNFRKQDKQPTFGLLSQVSPNGRYVASTVKDRSVFVPRPDLGFSQLFFPLKGILAIYDREKRSFKALPGADDPAYVHSNPAWSPDGQTIVFARAKAYDLKYTKNTTTALLRAEDCEEFLNGSRTFQFDLYRMPFNGGKGGTAVPLLGAAANGKSNFFAKYSPDGKWIVYCRANSFMLLQPDSELYIVPAEGGESRRLECNTNRMNSWHSWSPNSRWLVFASKANRPYTQLFLTHIDDQGRSSPPLVLSQFTANDRAANIPEFVNLLPGAISHIAERFVDDVSYMRTADENVKANDPQGAEIFCRKALGINPKNVHAHATLAGILIDSNRVSEAYQHLREALQLDPHDVDANYYLGNALAKKQRYSDAIDAWQKAVTADAKHSAAYSNMGGVLLMLNRLPEAERALKLALEADPNSAGAHHNLGVALSRLKRDSEAIQHWQQAARIDGNNVDTFQNLGIAMLNTGDVAGAVKNLERARSLDPNNATTLMHLGTAYGLKGDRVLAAELTNKAIQLARQTHQTDIEQEGLRRLNQ